MKSLQQADLPGLKTTLILSVIRHQDISNLLGTTIAPAITTDLPRVPFTKGFFSAYGFPGGQRPDSTTSLTRICTCVPVEFTRRPDSQKPGYFDVVITEESVRALIQRLRTAPGSLPRRFSTVFLVAAERQGDLPLELEVPAKAADPYSQWKQAFLLELCMGLPESVERKDLVLAAMLEMAAASIRARDQEAVSKTAELLFTTAWEFETPRPVGRPKKNEERAHAQALAAEGHAPNIIAKKIDPENYRRDPRRTTDRIRKLLPNRGGKN